MMEAEAKTEEGAKRRGRKPRCFHCHDVTSSKRTDSKGRRLCEDCSGTCAWCSGPVPNDTFDEDGDLACQPCIDAPRDVSLSGAKLVKAA